LKQIVIRIFKLRAVQLIIGAQNFFFSQAKHIINCRDN
jgi:hypothetical protein